MSDEQYPKKGAYPQGASPFPVKTKDELNDNKIKDQKIPQGYVYN